MYIPGPVGLLVPPNTVNNTQKRGKNTHKYHILYNSVRLLSKALHTNFANCLG